MAPPLPERVAGVAGGPHWRTSPTSSIWCRSRTTVTTSSNVKSFLQARSRPCALSTLKPYKVQAYVNAWRVALGTLVGRDRMAGVLDLLAMIRSNGIVVMASDSDAVSWLRPGGRLVFSTRCVRDRTGSSRAFGFTTNWRMLVRPTASTWLSPVWPPATSNSTPRSTTNQSPDMTLSPPPRAEVYLVGRTASTRSQREPRSNSPMTVCAALSRSTRSGSRRPWGFQISGLGFKQARRLRRLTSGVNASWRSIGSSNF